MSVKVVVFVFVNEKFFFICFKCLFINFFYNKILIFFKDFIYNELYYYFIKFFKIMIILRGIIIINFSKSYY